MSQFKRKLYNFAVFSLAILFAELIQTLAHIYIDRWKTGHGKYVAVLLSMVLAIAVFYPVFHFLEKHIQSASRSYVKNSRKAGGGGTTGLLVGYSLAMLFLFIAFSQLWYNKDVIADVGNWLKGLI
jgi:uncharacterized membrane protein